MSQVQFPVTPYQTAWCRGQSQLRNKYQYISPNSLKARNLSSVRCLTVKVEICFLTYLSNLTIFQKYQKHKRIFILYQASHANLLLTFSLSCPFSCHRDHQAKISTNNPLGGRNVQILIQSSDLMKTTKIQLNWKCFFVFLANRGHIHGFCIVKVQWMKFMRLYFRKIIFRIRYNQMIYFLYNI